MLLLMVDGIIDLCNILLVLLSDMSMGDIVKLFNDQKFLTDDDAQVIISAPSEHLKCQCLLKSLQDLKLTEWILICDILRSKSLENVSSHLMEGIIHNIFINIRMQYMHTCTLYYVCSNKKSCMQNEVRV